MALAIHDTHVCVSWLHRVYECIHRQTTTRSTDMLFNSIINRVTEWSIVQESYLRAWPLAPGSGGHLCRRRRRRRISRS